MPKLFIDWGGNAINRIVIEDNKTRYEHAEAIDAPLLDKDGKEIGRRPIGARVLPIPQSIVDAVVWAQSHVVGLANQRLRDTLKENGVHDDDIEDIVNVIDASKIK